MLERAIKKFIEVQDNVRSLQSEDIEEKLKELSTCEVEEKKARISDRSIMESMILLEEGRTDGLPCEDDIYYSFANQLYPSNWRAGLPEGIQIGMAIVNSEKRKKGIMPSNHIVEKRQIKQKRHRNLLIQAIRL